MALQASGAISLNDMHVEVGGTSGTTCSLNDADIRALISVGDSGQQSIQQYYGVSSETTLPTGGSTVNGQVQLHQINASDYISSGGTLIVPSNMWVWTNSTGTAALTIDIPCTVVNNGKIIGCGGRGGGTNGSPGNGGPAINVTSSGVTITNASGSYIAGGGGGGSAGGSYGHGSNPSGVGGGGGGAGGGQGGNGTSAAGGGAGGALNASGSGGSFINVYTGGSDTGCSSGAGGGAGGGGGAVLRYSNWADGGGGGRILPGSGGGGGYSQAQSGIRAPGAAGGSANGVGGNSGNSCDSETCGSGGDGGGGWGAAGGNSGGAGGSAISGTSRTLSNSGTIYGST